MSNLDYKSFSERRRPHIHPAGATLFVTYRLVDSIPQSVVRRYKAKREWLENELKRSRKMAMGSQASALKERLDRIEEFHRDWFLKFEDILHKAESGPMWLKDDRVAAKVAENLHRLDGEAYRLDAYCVMSNHVHTVFTPLLAEAELQETFNERGHLTYLSEHPGLSRIMHSLKGRAARECNLVLSRRGQFFEHESFDHVVRPGRLMSTIRYVLNNPVKAGLVKAWREWRWNYCRKELFE